MNFIKNNLANAFTLGNLLSGSIGAIHLIMGDYKTTALCIIISLILDFFDGFVARVLNANSNLGIHLDSLADMVSFGLIPGLTMYKLLEPFGYNFLGIALAFEIKYLGLMVTLISCLRLAIFNLDEEQKFYFKGLNTPSNAILIFGLYYTYRDYGKLSVLMDSPVFLLLLTAISCWLLVSPIKMIALKFKSTALKDNLEKIILFLGVILLMFGFGVFGIPLSVIFYIVVSLLFQKKLSSYSKS